MSKEPAVLSFKIYFKHNPKNETTTDQELDKLINIINKLKSLDSIGMSEWFMRGKTLKDAYLYELKDEPISLRAALKEKNRKEKGVISISLWNGIEGDMGASISYNLFTDGLSLSDYVISIGDYTGQSRLGTWQNIADLVQLLVNIWRPSAIYVGPFYDEAKVFPDKIGVGNMLYLPRVISQSEVPEAHAVVPVKDLGTILVSATDAPFSEHNKEHVRISNSIEIRLANNDWLPKYSEL